MADAIYVGSIGTDIILDVGQDITGATVSIEVKKPGGAVTTWEAVVHDSRFVRHTAVSGDLDEAGDYQVQPQVKLSDGTWDGPGRTAKFRVHNRFE